TRSYGDGVRRVLFRSVRQIECEVVSLRKLRDALEKRVFIVVDGGECEEFIDRTLAERPLDERKAEQLLDFRTEGEATAIGEVVKRLDPETITRAEQPSPFQVR